VELIKRFGTVEEALDRAAEVERKTYKESLLNNREIVLFSKRMATIDTNVPLQLDLEGMKCGDPDIDSLRALFSELEFTSLLKELLPVVQVTESQYGEGQVAGGRTRCSPSPQARLPVDRGRNDRAGPCGSRSPKKPSAMLPLQAAPSGPALPTHSVAISTTPGTATTISLIASCGRVAAALANPKIKRCMTTKRPRMLAPLNIGCWACSTTRDFTPIS
jgi:DNA polymerase-1